MILIVIAGIIFFTGVFIGRITSPGSLYSDFLLYEKEDLRGQISQAYEFGINEGKLRAQCPEYNESIKLREESKKKNDR